MNNLSFMTAVSALVWSSTSGAQTEQTASTDPYVQSLVANGLSQVEANNWSAALREAADVGTKIQADSPNRYAGQFVDYTPSRRVVIKLTGGADNLLSRFTSNPLIVSEVAKFSLAQLEKKKERLFESARGEGESIVVSVDMKNNKVLAVSKRGGKVTGKLKGLGLIGEDADIVEVNDPISSVTSASGGKINSASRNTSTPAGQTWSDSASLGFAVKYGTSSRGYLTAAHFDECKPSGGTVLTSCTTNQSATDPASGATLTFVRQSFTTDYDVELRSTTSSAIAPTNVVRYGGGGYAYTPYSITGTGNLALTNPVCKQGFATFYTCGTVADTAMLVSDVNSGLYGRFVRIQPNSGTAIMAGHGDSGGPVFSGGGLAMGITTAAFLDTSSPYYGQMVAMPISRISAVSAQVLTVP